MKIEMFFRLIPEGEEPGKWQYTSVEGPVRFKKFACNLINQQMCEHLHNFLSSESFEYFVKNAEDVSAKQIMGVAKISDVPLKEFEVDVH